MYRVADYMIQTLCEAGIRHIFLVTGRGLLFLTDAIAKEERIRGISTYHEQGASYAAMAYARASGELSACLVSTGCAATNAMTAALCAWQDNLPVLFISGQHMLGETTAYTRLPIRTYGSQEADIVTMVASITKYAVMVSDPKDIAIEMEKAMFHALEGRQGPVWIDVPLDVQNMRLDPEKLQHFRRKESNTNGASGLQENIAFVAEELRKSKRPILLIGGGTRSAKAGNVLQGIVEKLRLPVVFTPSASDVYGSSHPLSIGSVGTLGGSRAGNFALQNADFVLAVGTRLSSQVTGTDHEKFARSARLVVVDIDSNEHQKKEVLRERLILSDAKDFLEGLLFEDLPSVPEEWTQKCTHWKHLFSVSGEAFVLEMKKKNALDIYSFSDRLSSLLSREATVITDAGFEALIIPSVIRYQTGQQCLFPAAQGAMGYAIPAVLGAHFSGRKDIIVIVGDGSIMMNLQELQTISYHGIPAKIFVINNGMYAVIRRRQRDLFRNRTIGNDPSDGLGAPDFRGIAKAFGFSYMKWDTATDMEENFKEAMDCKEGLICEVMCTKEQEYLHKSYGVNERRRLEYRPLEDLSPFLDRELLKREMVIPLWKGGRNREPM